MGAAAVAAAVALAYAVGESGRPAPVAIQSIASPDSSDTLGARPEADRSPAETTSTPAPPAESTDTDAEAKTGEAHRTTTATNERPSNTETSLKTSRATSTGRSPAIAGTVTTTKVIEPTTERAPSTSAPSTSAPATSAPATTIPQATEAPTTAATAGQRSCDPNYSGCVPIASDVDCAGGTGNGPAYVQGPVRVIGTDIYGLDADKDGIGCETD